MKNIIVFVFFLSFPFLIYCQDDDFFTNEDNNETTVNQKKEHPGLDRWSFGGNLGLLFGTNTYIEVSPEALYKIHPRLYAGPGFTYIYYKYGAYNYQTSTYGIRGIATLKLLTNINESIGINIGDIVAHSEIEYMNRDCYLYGVSEGRDWITNILVGGGIFQPFANRGGISLLVLFDVSQNVYSPYSNPVFKVGFYF